MFRDFRYTRALEAPDARDHALVFEARVGDRELESCDFLHVGDDELYVMVRPLSAAVAFAEAMRQEPEPTHDGVAVTPDA